MRSGFAGLVGAGLIITAATAASAPAHAAVRIIQGTGTVTGIETSRGVPTGSVAVGDVLRFRFAFDPATAALLFSGGPSFQVFAQPMADISMTLGSYVFARGDNAATPPVVLLGTGFALFPPVVQSEPVFSQQFIFPGKPLGNAPFAWGPGGGSTFSLSSQFRADFMGAAPTPADIKSPADAYNNRFTLAVGDANGTVGYVEGRFTATLAPVPEPETWAMLILGFGMIGGAMRRRPRSARVRFISPLA